MMRDRRTKGRGRSSGRDQRDESTPKSFRARAAFLFGVLAVAACGLLWRAVDLQLMDHGFLARQGDARY